MEEQIERLMTARVRLIDAYYRNCHLGRHPWLADLIGQKVREINARILLAPAPKPTPRPARERSRDVIRR